MLGPDYIALWSQGSVIPNEALNKIDLLNAESSQGLMGVVISHDCDLARSFTQEPKVEIILGKTINQINGGFSNAKSPRILHIALPCGKNIELDATKKNAVLKQHLFAYKPCTDCQFSDNNLVVLQNWLAARYRRSAFPNKFNEHLKKVEKQIKKTLQSSGEYIYTVFFDVNSSDEAEQIYTLGITIVHTTDDYYEKAYVAANEAKKQIELIFNQTFYSNKDGWHDIELQGCDVVADTTISYWTTQRLKAWRLDDLSLSSDPIQPMNQS